MCGLGPRVCGASDMATFFARFFLPFGRRLPDGWEDSVEDSIPLRYGHEILGLIHPPFK